MKMIEQNEQKYARMRKKIMDLIGISEQDINNLMFELAIEYMEVKAIDGPIRETFLREPLFWQWWRAQWYLIDEAYWYIYFPFFNKLEHHHEKLQDKYVKYHRSIDQYPDKIIWEKIHQAYEKSAQQIIKKHRTEELIIHP